MRPQAVSVWLQYPGQPPGAPITLNQTSAEAANAGAPSLISGITYSQSIAAPLGDAQAANSTVTISSNSATPIPRLSLVIVSVKWAGNEFRRLFKGVVDQDRVTRLESLWLHTLTITDALDEAAGVRLGIDLPQQSLTARRDALRFAWGHLIGYSWMAYGIIFEPWQMAAVTADTDLLSVLRRTAIATGCIITPSLDTLPVPGSIRNASWWWWTIYRGLVHTPISAANLTDSASVLSRISHLATVEISHKHRQDDGTDIDVKETITDGGTEYATCVIPTDMLTTGTTPDIAVTYLRKVASTLVAAPPTPALDTVRLINADAALIQSMPEGPWGLLDIDPAPAHSSRYQVITEVNVTIGHNLETRIEWGLTPAAMFGMVPIRPTHLGQDRFVADVKAYPDVIRFQHLAINRPEGTSV